MGRRAFIGITALATAVVAAAACGWTSDHLVSPSQPDGYIPSPPRYVRIVDWIRPDLFEAKYYQSGRWYDDFFMVVTRDETEVPLREGWYAPVWSKQNPMPELTPEEEITMQAMVSSFPTGSDVMLDYPLLDDKSKIGAGRSVDVPRSSVRATASYTGAYTVAILDESPPDDVLPRE